MEEHEAVNKKVGEWYDSVADASEALVKWSNQFIDQDWRTAVGIMLALILLPNTGNPSAPAVPTLSRACLLLFSYTH